MAGVIIVFSAASGAGKSTILNIIQKRMPELVYSISSTTRAPRGNEKDGVDYFFLSKEEFKAKIDEGGFAEWAEVHGNYYGTSVQFLESQLNRNKTIILDIDVQGKAQLDTHFKDAKGVFIEVPSAKELERRLRSRGTDSEEDIKIRLNNATKEQEYARFKCKYDYYLINDNLEECVGKVERIIKLITKQLGE